MGEFKRKTLNHCPLKLLFKRKREGHPAVVSTLHIYNSLFIYTLLPYAGVADRPNYFNNFLIKSKSN